MRELVRHILPQAEQTWAVCAALCARRANCEHTLRGVFHGLASQQGRGPRPDADESRPWLPYDDTRKLKRTR